MSLYISHLSDFILNFIFYVKICIDFVLLHKTYVQGDFRPVAYLYVASILIQHDLALEFQDNIFPEKFLDFQV